MFTGCTLTADNIQELINAPENAFLLQCNARAEYIRLQWGIEAVSGSDGSVSPILVRN